MCFNTKFANFAFSSLVLLAPFLIYSDNEILDYFLIIFSCNFSKVINWRSRSGWLVSLTLVLFLLAGVIFGMMWLAGRRAILSYIWLLSS
jgi:hypothetical protein